MEKNIKLQNYGGSWALAFRVTDNYKFIADYEWSEYSCWYWKYRLFTLMLKRTSKRPRLWNVYWMEDFSQKTCRGALLIVPTGHVDIQQWNCTKYQYCSKQEKYIATCKM